MKNGYITALSIGIAVLLSALLVFTVLGGNDRTATVPDFKEDSGTTENTDDILNTDVPENLPEIPEIPEIQQPEKVSFIACGDNLVHTSVYTQAKINAEGTDKDYDFLPMYEYLADDIKNADLAFINQETPLAESIKPISGYPVFNSPDRVGYDLAELGFDIIGIANNHMLDASASGYLKTIEFWENIPDVISIGGYKNKEDYENIRIVEKNGIKIALLAFTYSTNGIKLPSNSEMVIPYYDDEEIDRLTKKSKELADCVIVSIHWGEVEGSFDVDERQKRKAQIMVDNGVDVIIGHHTHVLQPLKWVERADGGRTLLAYSLGNFLSGMMYSKFMVGGMLGFDIVKYDDGIKIENASFIPTMCHYLHDGNLANSFKLYRFSDYTEELEKEHGAHRFDKGMSIEYMRGIIDRMIPDEFLTEDYYK